MLDSHPEKQKQGQRDKEWDAYLALLLGVGACLLLLICLNSTADFDSRYKTFFYPLVLLNHSPAFSPVFGLSALILFLGAMMYAAWRGANLVGVIFASLIGVGLLGGALIVSVFLAPNITSQQTLMHKGHIYHLATVRDGTVGIDSPILSYMVFQCDEAGWLCRLYATPYGVDSYLYRSRKNMQFEKFYPSDKLFIDEVDQTLKLRVGDEIYPIISPDESRG